MIRIAPDDGLSFLDTDEGEKEPAWERNGPLQKEDSEDDECNAGVKKPVGQQGNSVTGSFPSAVTWVLMKRAGE